jgi:serine/threonine-protein kinase RsbW
MILLRMKVWPLQNLNMFPDKPELTITIPSKTELLKMVVELTKHIATINKFVPSDSQKIALAVDEAITNVIKHSYLRKKDKDIRLEYFANDKGLKIKIVFKGIPPVLSKEGVDVAKYIKEKRKSGLGVELMRKIMDSVEYKTVNNTNYCEMIKWKTKK